MKGWDFNLKTAAERGMVLSPGNDIVWFALEKTHSDNSKAGGWGKASQEARRAFEGINVRCGGWCSGENSEAGRKE